MKKKTFFIGVDGTIKEVTPKDGKDFSLEELRSFIEGTIQWVPMPDGSEMMVHDEGRLIGLDVNKKASEVFQKLYPIEQYPENNDGIVVGDILLTGSNVEELVK